MGKFRLATALAILAAGAYGLAGCATTAEVAPKPQPAAAPASTAPSDSASAQADNGWNLFPDPTTGEIAVYHNGKYMGVITGNEPGDPPMPHKPAESRPRPPTVNP